MSDFVDLYRYYIKILTEYYTVYIEIRELVKVHPIDTSRVLFLCDQYEKLLPELDRLDKLLMEPYNASSFRKTT